MEFKGNDGDSKECQIVIQPFQINDTISDILSSDSIVVWKSFLEQNEDSFRSVTLKSEMSHDQHALYIEFTTLLETCIAQKCEGNGIGVVEFYNFCKHHAADPNISVFCTLLNLSTSFEAFIDIASDPNKRKYFFSIINSWKTELDRERGRK